MNIQTKLLEDYINFVDLTKKNKKILESNFNVICGFFMFVFSFCVI